MGKYLKKIDPMIWEYFKILSDDFPEFLLDYIETPRMQKQDRISVSCGTFYSKMFDNIWYSSLDHSVAVALIIWNFTHDKKQTLAGLFHDISTPAFKHCIDFMNNDYETQESTEDLTRTMILESKEIMHLLNRDNISIDEVSDYHIYPIANNDTPKLSADRLEYTLSNALGQIKKIWDLDEVKKIYSNIYIVNKEDGTPEMCFKDKEIAERFVEVMSELSVLYMNDNRRFGMQFLADMCKSMNNAGYLTIDDLYTLSESEIISKFLNCDDSYLSESFKRFQNADKVYRSNKHINGKYCVNIKAKTRYVSPLVLTENGAIRINRISKKANDEINAYINLPKGGYFTYFDFNFKPY